MTVAAHTEAHVVDGKWAAVARHGNRPAPAVWPLVCWLAAVVLRSRSNSAHARLSISTL